MDEFARAILDFWLDEIGPEGWYAVDPELDARIRDRFLDAWERGRNGELDAWRCTPEGSLALTILLDQFPRNMFRGDARSFASDAKALEVSKGAIAKGFDRRIEGPGQQFFYLPLMHSEIRSEQDRSVRLFLLNLGRNDNLRHARAHREVIRRFGRFPYRNEALGRRNTPAETAFLDAGGYGAALAEVPA